MEKLVEQLQSLWEEHRSQIYVVIGLVLAVGFWWWHTHQPVTDAVGATSQSSAYSATSAVTSSLATSTENGSGRVWVDVKGAVNKPGVYHLKKGARVQEAIAAAGSQTSLADLNQVNLAKELQDQQVVYVPAQGEKVADATTATTGTTDATSATSQSGQGDSVNLNTATKEQLQTIDGIGDKKADKIIAYRQEHGGFKTVEDLKNVDGFGDKTVAKIKDRLAV